MSQLETKVQPFLQPLLMGQSGAVEITSQAVIALWVVKTSMVLEGLDPTEKRMYTQEQRERFRSSDAIPWRTSIWLAASADPAWFMSTKNRHIGMTAGAIAGMSTTMTFGHIALPVLTMRVPKSVGPKTLVTTDVRRGPWDELTAQIWPPRASINWPPAMGVNGEGGLDVLAERFSTVNYSGEIELIAV